MDLFQASNQWATRPDDERFWTLREAHDATFDYFRTAIERTVPYSDLRVEASDDDVLLVGKANNPARLTHWAFGQLAQRCGAPAGYLRELPATLAAQNLNHGLKHHAGDEKAVVLFHRNGDLLARAFTSDIYNRIWNHEVIRRAIELESRGWRVPPARPARDGQRGARPATEADILDRRDGGGGLSVNVGDLIAPAGIYASDHDCFLFLVNENNRIEDGSEGGLSRGVFITNSEVGAASLRITRFYYRHVCGNHIVWDASNVVEVRLRHVGESVGDRFRQAIQAQVSWVNDKATTDRDRIKQAQTFLLGDNKDEVLDKLFGVKSLGLSRITCDTAYAKVLPEVDGDPRTAWGFAQGLTRLSQQTSFTDERDRLDRAAGKVIEFAF